MRNSIEDIKYKFGKILSKKLKLHFVDAPLILDEKLGMNDFLSGTEIPIKFESNNNNYQIVQSLAKWKRYALTKLNYNGIITNMKAIRSSEIIDNIHNIVVEQWDYEMRMNSDDRNLIYLSMVVKKIYECIKDIEQYAINKYNVKKKLPNNIDFIQDDEINDEIIKNHKAVCSYKIKNNRSPDYDDWDLNCDIIVWSDEINSPIELSSMGVRVNKTSLIMQCKEKNMDYLLEMPWHKMLLNGELPQTIGGGIGQSRLCMFILDKNNVNLTDF